MTDKQKVALAVKAIRDFAVEHWGWGAKYHEDQRDKYDALMEFAKKLEKGGDK